MTAGRVPGQTAYEARFSRSSPREVTPFEDLDEAARSLWAEVEEACTRELRTQLVWALETVELMSVTLGGLDGRDPVC